MPDLLKVSAPMHHSLEFDLGQAEVCESLDSPAYSHDKEALLLEEVITVHHSHRIVLMLRLCVADDGAAEAAILRTDFLHRMKHL